ncbi:hypothetical protein DM860_007886 [Cuscuta australis]|uniref:NAD(P)-binding domain-containing protein n=1 Tax=Cuscuta australis TaxID=267555 RepID=A0A328DWY4_9ASTE|nr:hypothetical protein DM860_007886 [Cuscuta australis]
MTSWEFVDGAAEKQAEGVAPCHRRALYPSAVGYPPRSTRTAVRLPPSVLTLMTLSPNCILVSRSYVHSNMAGFVSLLEVCKSGNPQPAIVCASSSFVYGLNSKVPFSESDRTDQPMSFYAATKKAGKAIAHPIVSTLISLTASLGLYGN